MCILIRLSPFDTLTHSNSPNVCFVIFGWNKNKVHTIDIMIYLFISPNLAGDIKYIMLHNNTNIMISIIGNNIVRNVLNISLEGAKILISLSFMNQSNDKKAFEDEPRNSKEPKIWTKLSGNFKFSENAEAISCK